MNKNNTGISKEDLHFYDIGLRLCGFSTTPANLERFVYIIEGISKHKGKFSVKHLAKIDAFIAEKYDEDLLISGVEVKEKKEEEGEEEEKPGDEDLVREEDPKKEEAPQHWDLKKDEDR